MKVVTADGKNIEPVRCENGTLLYIVNGKPVDIFQEHPELFKSKDFDGAICFFDIYLLCGLIVADDEQVVLNHNGQGRVYELENSNTNVNSETRQMVLVALPPNSVLSINVNGVFSDGSGCTYNFRIVSENTDTF